MNETMREVFERHFWDRHEKDTTSYHEWHEKIKRDTKKRDESDMRAWHKWDKSKTWVKHEANIWERLLRETRVTLKIGLSVTHYVLRSSGY